MRTVTVSIVSGADRFHLSILPITYAARRGQSFVRTLPFSSARAEESNRLRDEELADFR